MAFEIVMPRLGWTMEAGSLTEWHKKDGDTVEVGEILFSVEAEKAVQEVEGFESGILRIPPDSPPPGTQVPVGTVLGYLVKLGEPAPFERQTMAAAAAPGPAAAQTHTGPPTLGYPGSGSVASPDATPAISPRARRVAAELGVDWTTLMGSGRNGRIEERDVQAAAAAKGDSTAGARRQNPG